MGKATKKAESKCLQGKETRGKPVYTPGPQKAQEFIILGSPEDRHKARLKRRGLIGPHEEACVPGACPTYVARHQPLPCQAEEEVHSERTSNPGARVWGLGIGESKMSCIQEKN